MSEALLNTLAPAPAPQLPSYGAEDRRAAFERFHALGLPGRRDEDWRFSVIPRLLKERLSAQQEAPTAQAAEEAAGAPLFEASEALTITLSGEGSAEAFQRARAAAPAGLAIFSLAHDQLPDALESRLSSAQDETLPFVALNSACFDEGVALSITEKIEQPIVLEHWRGREKESAHRRVLLSLGEGAEATVIERFQSAGEGFSNLRTLVELAPKAKLTYIRLQEEDEAALHLARFDARVAEEALLTATLLDLGGCAARIEQELQLTGSGAQVDLSGLYAGRDTQQLEQQLLIDHQAPGCESGQRFRGILAAESRGIFRGRVRVAPGASKSVAHQHNPNLLLGLKARAVTLPQLEIHNDDVQCSHGATVGRLDEDALFYLRARGIDEEAARGLLTEAFAAEVLAPLPKQVGARAQSAISRVLEAAAEERRQ